MAVNVAITEIEDLVDHARLRLDDVPLPAAVDESALLWTTEELMHFANEAFREVAIRTRCIRDSARDEADVTLYEVTAGTGEIVVDPRVLVIRRVWWNDEVLTPDSEQFLDEQRADYNRTAYLSLSSNETPNWRTTPVEIPTRFVLERSSRRLLTVGVPTVDGEIKLDVIRLPLEIIETGAPEIPQSYLADCLDWICSLAYLKNDSETANPALAEKFAAEFERKVGPRPTNLQLQLEYHQAGRRRARLHWF